MNDFQILQTEPSPRAPSPRVGNNAVELRGVTKLYYRGRGAIEVLKNLDLEVPEAGFAALMGPSGSGKTTLLNLIAGLDTVSSGSMQVAGADPSKMSEALRAKWRASTIGFVFQTYNMMPVLTALENVELPLLLTGLSRRERRERAEIALRAVSLIDRAHHLPRQLSGGQEQRVAIARAIVTDPRLIVADEPTGDLDRHSADEILELFVRLNQEHCKTIVMVTHDPRAAEHAQRVVHLEKGALVSGYQ
jgi:putative ABC transport system ATP-binding protein